jgi:hypothetical protein
MGDEKYRLSFPQQLQSFLLGGDLEFGEFYRLSFFKSRTLTRSAHEGQRVMKIVTGSIGITVAH